MSWETLKHALEELLKVSQFSLVFDGEQNDWISLLNAHHKSSFKVFYDDYCIIIIIILPFPHIVVIAVVNWNDHSLYRNISSKPQMEDNAVLTNLVYE